MQTREKKPGHLVGPTQGKDLDSARQKTREGSRPNMMSSHFSLRPGSGALFTSCSAGQLSDLKFQYNSTKSLELCLNNVGERGTVLISSHQTRSIRPTIIHAAAWRFVRRVHTLILNNRGSAGRYIALIPTVPPFPLPPPLGSILTSAHTIRPTLSALHQTRFGKRV